MSPQQACHETLLRTHMLPIRKMKLSTWDRKPASFRKAQHELYENICREIDRRKTQR